MKMSRRLAKFAIVGECLIPFCLNRMVSIISKSCFPFSFSTSNSKNCEAFFAFLVKDMNSWPYIATSISHLVSHMTGLSSNMLNTISLLLESGTDPSLINFFRDFSVRSNDFISFSSHTLSRCVYNCIQIITRYDRLT